MENLPNISELSFFRKTRIEGKDFIILRPKNSEKYRIIFDCPRCNQHNDYESNLQIIKKKNDKFFKVKCQFCQAEFDIIQLKAR